MKFCLDILKLHYTPESNFLLLLIKKKLLLTLMHKKLISPTINTTQKRTAQSVLLNNYWQKFFNAT